ncbi:hypothetical protein [Silvanigrella sp.]|uniref:hypothetical protein n=1 Tax=Silvanigrella sp. TaxID=2024976 RepID=UPI0037CBF1EC
MYQKDLDEIKHLYFKTLNYSRYLKALKTPLSLQIGSARLGLLKSLDFLFKSDSALFQFVKNNIKIDDKSIYHYIEVIKDTLNKKYKKKLSDEEVNFYLSLIFKVLISSYSSKNETDTFNKKLESQLSSDINIKKFGNDASKWMKKINSNSLFLDRNYGYTKNLFTGNDFDKDLTLNSLNNSSQNNLMSVKGLSQTSYVTLGGTLIYDIVLGLCYFKTDGIPSGKKENFNEWLKILFGISFMAQNAMGFANGISVCSTGVALDQLSSHLNGISTSLNSSLINRLFPSDPISLFVQDIGYFAVTNVIGHAEKKCGKV